MCSAWPLGGPLYHFGHVFALLSPSSRTRCATFSRISLPSMLPPTSWLTHPLCPTPVLRAFCFKLTYLLTSCDHQTVILKRYLFSEDNSCFSHRNPNGFGSTIGQSKQHQFHQWSDTKSLQHWRYVQSRKNVGTKGPVPNLRQSNVVGLFYRLVYEMITVLLNFLAICQHMTLALVAFLFSHTNIHTRGWWYFSGFLVDSAPDYCWRDCWVQTL